MQLATVTTENGTPGMDEELVIDTAYEILEHRLEQFGNKVSPEQQEALRFMLGCFARMAAGTQLYQKEAIPLPTGLGKSTACLSFCAALHRLVYGAPVLIASSYIENLCQGLRDLVELGVPREKIGLIHTAGKDASEPATEGNGSRQFLFLTHAKIKTRRDIEDYLYTDCKAQRVVIWDEALVKSEGTSLNLRSLEIATAALNTESLQQESSINQRAGQYMRECLKRFKAELDRQRQLMKPQTVLLPERTEDELERYDKEAFSTLSEKQSNRVTLLKLLRAVKFDLSVGVAGNSDGVLYYRLVIPKQLEPVTILDASLPISTMQQLDSSIHINELKAGVSYENVHFHVIDFNSGKKSIVAHVYQKHKERRKLVHEIVDIVKSLPETEAVLFFTYKKKDNQRDSMQSIFTAALRRAGIDLDAQVEVQQADGTTKLLPRFCWSTHGMELGLNCYSYVRHVVPVGLLRMRELDVLAAMRGQVEDNNATFTAREIKDTQDRQAFYRLHQQVNRAQCRIIRDNKTLPVDVWLPYPHARLPWLQRNMESVMPGVQHSKYDPKWLVGVSITQRVKKGIMEYLDSLPKSVKQVSTNRLKKELGLQDVPKNTFTRSITLIREYQFSGWELRGRSLVRTSL